MNMARKTALCLVLALLTVSCSRPGVSPDVPDPPLTRDVSEPPPEPSPVPSPAPSPVPSPLPSPEPPPEPSPSPEPDYNALFVPHCLPETDPEALGIGFAVKSEKIYGDIAFGLPGAYTGLGVTTFRGNNFRDNPTWGTASVSEEKLTALYSLKIGVIDTWSGVGWNGQPSIVRWEPEVIENMNIYPEKKAKVGLTEVIHATLDGKIYFFDLDDGEPTRDPIINGEPLKGSVTVDPRGYPLLYAGQGVTYGNRFGYFIYSLIDGEELLFINGYDTFASRGWAAFDSNPLFDAEHDMMVLCGENGLVYSIKLNTDYDRENGTVSVSPEISRYRYTNKRWRLGIENSPSAFLHYLFFSDNGGYVHCVDLKTLEPVWSRDCSDDTDASVVLDWEEETDTLALYTGCETDFRGESPAYIRKLNAANGELLWETEYDCRYDETNGGVMGTPVSGKHDIADCVIFLVAKVKRPSGGNGGTLVCLDKRTGEVVWENAMSIYGWSSPVAVYTEEGKSYLIVCDAGGSMYLIRGTTGEIADKISVGSNVEGSAAVYGNKLVVGTRGQRIYCVELS